LLGDWLKKNFSGWEAWIIFRRPPAAQVARSQGQPPHSAVQRPDRNPLSAVQNRCGDDAAGQIVSGFCLKVILYAHSVPPPQRHPQRRCRGSPQLLSGRDFGEHGSGKSSIMPLSLGAPMPDVDHLAVEYGGEEAALKAASERSGRCRAIRGWR